MPVPGKRKRVPETPGKTAADTDKENEDAAENTSDEKTETAEAENNFLRS